MVLQYFAELWIIVVLFLFKNFSQHFSKQLRLGFITTKTELVKFVANKVESKLISGRFY